MAEDADRQLAILTAAIGEDRANAIKAKDAIVELVRRHPEAFEGHFDAEQLACLDLLERPDDEMRCLGQFVINLREPSYRCRVFIGADRSEGLQFFGRFLIEGQHWKAVVPYRVDRERFRRPCVGPA